MFESLCARAEKYNQGNGTLVHRQVVNAINETKRKIDRRESLSAADESERMSAAEKLISSVRFLKSHAMSIFFPRDQSQTELLRPMHIKFLVCSFFIAIWVLDLILGI